MRHRSADFNNVLPVSALVAGILTDHISGNKRQFENASSHLPNYPH